MLHVEVLSEFANQLSLLDRIDPEVRFQIGFHLDHVSGIARLINHEVDHERLHGGPIHRHDYRSRGHRDRFRDRDGRGGRTRRKRGTDRLDVLFANRLNRSDHAACWSTPTATAGGGIEEHHLTRSN